MIENQTSALVIDSPGSLRDSLKTLLRAVPCIKAVHQADDVPSALEVIMAQHPSLVLLDGRFSIDQISSVIKATQRSQSLCLVLADDERKQQQAKAAGASVAVVKGIAATKLFEIIEGLLFQQVME